MRDVLAVQVSRFRGGPAIQHLSFLAGLEAHGYRCHAVLPEDQPMLEEFRATCASVHIVSGMQTVPRTRAPARLFAYAAQGTAVARRIARVGREVRASLVHTFTEAFPPGGLAARLLRVPSVFQVLGRSILEPPGVARVYARLLGALGDRVACCQSEIAGRLSALGVPERKLAVVYNSVDPAAVRARAERGGAAPKGPGEVRIGMVAGLEPRKGHLVLAQAARLVADVVPEARFYVVGVRQEHTDYYRELRAFLDAHAMDEVFHLLGAVEHPEPWMRSFDVYCIASHDEALSVAGLEAMALATPLVATAVGGNVEAVADGESGLLCRPGDPQDLADKIIELCRDPARRGRMGQASSARVDATFTVAENTRRLAQVFDEAVTEAEDRWWSRVAKEAPR